MLHNKSFTDQEGWILASFFQYVLWTLTSSKFINMQKRYLANIQSSESASLSLSYPIL